MSRSERDKLEAEREARRAKRLSDRAEQRAHRKAEQAQRAAERAAQLAERVKSSRRSNPRRRQTERSIEDVVDDVADKWTRKAESWIDEQSKKMFNDLSILDSEDLGLGGTKKKRSSDNSYGHDENDYDESDYHESEFGSADYDEHEEDGTTQSQGYRRDRRQQRRRERMKRRKARLKAEFGFEKERKHFKRRNRNGNLYKNTQNKKIFGVCSGIADYWGMETWQVRMMAVVALFVVPSIAIPGYFISSFLMDEKPYYRKVTDRFNELNEDDVAGNEQDSQRPSRRKSDASTSRRSQARGDAAVTNIEVLRKAKLRFSDIENRLRVMETHVTSPKFELQRELRKIAGDEG